MFRPYSDKILVENVHIKTLKNAPTCFDLIRIIFREFICSLLKLLILKFVKNVKSQCGDAAACCRITTLTFTFLTNFKISNFNKEHMSSLKMIRIRSKHVGAFLNVLM